MTAMATSQRGVGVTARGRACAIAVVLLVVSGTMLSLQTGGHAQTIDTQDTRTFQDNRVQDTRQSPVPVSPDEAARLKRLTEEAAAEQKKDVGDKKKSEAAPPEQPPSPRPK